MHMTQAHPTNAGLIAGPGARALRRSKVIQVLMFTHKVHVVTTTVISKLLGSTSSNTSRLLRDLVAQDLIQEVNLRHCDRAPRGRGFVLRPDGVRLVLQHLGTRPHDYNTRPESIKHEQLSHDLTMTEFAASWVHAGGELLHTDYTLRQQSKGNKLPDLMLRWLNTRLVVEFERLDKKPRELDQKLLAAFSGHSWPTLWLSDVPSNLSYLRDRLEASQVDVWRLNAAHKWGREGQVALPVDFRARQLLHRLDEQSMTRHPQAWCDDMTSLTKAVRQQCVAALQDHGWSWGASDPVTWQGEDIHQFYLQIDGAKHSGAYFVTHMGQGKWRVCSAEQTPGQGIALDRSMPWTPADGKPIPLRVLELATQTIAAYDFRMPR